jgi:hypothetical protein
VQRSIDEIAAIALLSSRVHAGDLDLEAAVEAAPYRPGAAREAIERGIAQLSGELDA